LRPVHQPPTKLKIVCHQPDFRVRADVRNLVFDLVGENLDGPGCPPELKEGHDQECRDDAELHRDEATADGDKSHHSRTISKSLRRVKRGFSPSGQNDNMRRCRSQDHGLLGEPEPPQDGLSHEGRPPSASPRSWSSGPARSFTRACSGAKRAAPRPSSSRRPPYARTHHNGHAA